MSEFALGYPLTKEQIVGPSFYKRYESEIAGLAAGLALMTPLFLALAKQELVDNAAGTETTNVRVVDSSEFAGHIAANNVIALAGPADFGRTESVLVTVPLGAE